jgi:predicted NBD/HSP70 family sugar kinase
LTNFQVATTRTARDINRRIVLNLIRKHQPISRADLSRRSRLQRSTVSAITEQLITERWVTTGSYGDLPRGRKPAFLHLNGERAGVIGIDIRPVETTVVLSDLDLHFLVQTSLPTNPDSSQFITELCGRLRQLMKAHPHIAFEGIGVALPGRVELSSSRLMFAPNLGWQAVDFRKPIEEATGLPVEVENAANACALAEFWSGVHPENVRNLIVVTVSEGVGAGMIFNGQLVRGSTGMAGEFGHVTLQENGPLCKCGNRGCFEAYASNAAAVRHFKECVANKGENKPASEPNFDLILKLAGVGNQEAGESLDRMAHFLGMGLALIITGLGPDVIVLVGEVTQAWKRVGPIVNEVIAQRSPTKAKPRILTGADGMQPRLRGAVALVLQKHFGALNFI